MIQNPIIQKLSNIKVAIRVRSLENSEGTAESTYCVKKYYGGLEIVNSERKNRLFFPEYCFWSQDKNQNEQEEVFDGIGRDLLKSAWEGYNCCLISYGQTGVIIHFKQAGKSYTMFGTKSQRGIVYRFCDELFKNIESSQVIYEVWISVCEIATGGLYDRLQHWTSTTELRIKEGPHIGIYIPDLQWYLVKSYSEIEQLIALGIENQIKSNCRMGRHTWRSTLIIQLELKQIIGNTRRISKIKFVDMAGSEDIKKQSSAQKDQMKTECTIRDFKVVLQRLSAKNKEFVPYRNSNLTRILQNALGGNCQTYMICSILPSSINYEETLSTLKNSSRAGKIVNRLQIFRFQDNLIIDTQFAQLLSLKEDINQLVQQLREQNQKSTYLLQQIRLLRDEISQNTENVNQQ